MDILPEPIFNSCNTNPITIPKDKNINNEVLSIKKKSAIADEIVDRIVNQLN